MLKLMYLNERNDLSTSDLGALFISLFLSIYYIFVLTGNIKTNVPAHLGCKKLLTIVNYL